MLEHANTKSDEEIIELYNSGNQEIFKTLIERYTSPIYNFTARLTDRDRAHDIVQDTFIKAWENLSKFNPERASFKTWIFTIAKNTATDTLRKKKSLLFSDMRPSGIEETGESNFEESIPDESLLPDEALDKLADEQTLHKIMAELRPEYREILVLHYQESMTFDEIGKILNKPLNTVKSQHRRAIIELRGYIE